MKAILSSEKLDKDNREQLRDPSSDYDPKAKRWRNAAFKDLLGSYIKREYNRDDIKITNKFA